MGKNKEELSDFDIKFNDLLSKIEGYEKAFENKIIIIKSNVPKEYQEVLKVFQ